MTTRAWICRTTDPAEQADASQGSAKPVITPTLDVIADDAFDAVFGESSAGQLDLEVIASGINYKDAMLLTGVQGIARRFPIVAGIDLAGRVTASRDDRFAPGDLVHLNGAGLSETINGGLAERARIPGDLVLKVPRGFSAHDVAGIGTAGFTAALSVLKLRRAVAPDAGPVLVTGASGGVGSFAIALLARLGYEVVASTSEVARRREGMLALGASDVIERDELSGEGKPLQRERWAGAIDSVGSHTLVNVLAQTRWGGTVTACGRAQGSDLPGTVLPFILRDVTLAGVNSVEAPRATREEAWRLIADEVDRELIGRFTATRPLEDALEVAGDVMAGRVDGRVVIRVAEDAAAH